MWKAWSMQTQHNTDQHMTEASVTEGPAHLDDDSVYSDMCAMLVP